MAPNIRYINQSAPFWDWIASFEDQAGEHPFFGGSAPRGPPPPPGAPGAAHPPHPPHPPHGPPPPGPWGWGPWGRHHHHGRNWHADLPTRGGPSNNAEGEASDTNQASENDATNEKRAAGAADDNEDPVPDPPEDSPQPPREGCPGRRGRRGCHGGRRGEGRHHGFGHHPYARWGGFPGGRGFAGLSELFGGAQQQTGDDDWKPEADVFDTEAAYVVHLSLPGAHKEDIGVAWDPEKSELSVAGVVHRPGDEEFLKTLALDERRVGAFERKVRLGTRASPAQVDVDGITAKLENGILFVEVPKLNGEFVEIKKVDIE